MIKTFRIASIALCMLILVLPTLAMPFFPLEATDTQGQYLADYPQLADGDGALNREFDSEFESWLCDHFAFREAVLRFNALLNYRLLRASLNERVVVGRGDWLYLADTAADYTGEGRLSQAELDILSENLDALSRAVSQRGGRLYIAVIPNKSTVYPAYMPGRYAMREDGGNIDLLRKACEALPVQWIDLLSPLTEAAGNGELLYYKTDTHWNALGATIAARAALEAMGREATDYASAGEEDFSAGDLARLMGAGGAIHEVAPRVQPASPLPVEDYSLHRLAVDGPGEDRLLVYRDSFGTAIGPWLAGAYGETELRWEYPLDGTRPCDDALILICERNLREYLLEPPLLSDDAPGEDETPADGDFVDIDEDDDFFTDDAPDGDDDFPGEDARPADEDFMDIDEDDDFFTDDAPDGDEGPAEGRA